MTKHNEDIRLALWKNERKEKSTQPILKGGKPVNIDGREYWVSAWVNGPKDNEVIAHRIQSMVDFLADELGSFPIVSISLTPAESRGYIAPPTTAPAAGSSAGGPDDSLDGIGDSDIPF